LYRGRRRRAPKFRLQLRFRRNRSGWLRRRSGAGWRRHDPRARRSCGPDGGPGAGSRAGCRGSRYPRWRRARRKPGVWIDGAWRYRSARRRGRSTPGAWNRQCVGPRQRLVRRQRARCIDRLRHIRPSGRPCARQTSPHGGRIDRSTRRYWRLALLDQRRPLGDRRRQCRRRATLPRRGRSAGPSGTKSVRGRRWLRRPVDDVVDDGAVVDVGKDDVVRRRRHIARSPHIDRDRHEIRLRQDEQPDRRQWRLQYHEIVRRRRQVVDRRGWRRDEIEIWIAEGQHRSVDIGELFRRRRRHVVVDDVKRRRRLQRRGENGKAAARVGGMRPARIALQI